MRTDPVKLISAKNSKHQNHPCTNFAKTTTNALEEFAGHLGPCEVTFHSQDDRAKVPIVITAASKQAPLLMYMEYQVILPDHDYIVVPQHKLISSVVVDMKITENDFSGDPLLILAQRTAQFEVVITLAPMLIIIYKI